MAYAQRDYPNTLQGMKGTHTPKYTIKQIGCFLTSFANLKRRLSPISKSPKALNTEFKEKKIWIDVDDGIKDDLYWGAMTKYSKNYTVVNTGLSGVPKNAAGKPTKNAIVKLKAGNDFGTHFCLVKDIVGSTVYIVDSWDGKIKKSSTYGPIIGWAAYKWKKVQ